MKHALYTFFLCFCVFNTVNAQTPDSSFGTNGKTVLPEYSEFEELKSTLLQPDGKILLGGYDYDETFYFPSISVWRINTDGSVDQSFGQNGQMRFSSSPVGSSAYGGEIALQPDNKIIGVGTQFDRNEAYRNHVLLFRLKTDGTFDSSFGYNGRSYANFGSSYCTGNALVLKTNGKIVVSGILGTNYDASRRAELAQFLPNGKIDSSFGVNGLSESRFKVQQQGLALALLPGNKVLAGFLYNGNTTKTCLIKYNANGTIDNSFGDSGIVVNANTVNNYGEEMALTIQPDGKILEYVMASANNVLYRYNANGRPDKSFGVNGVVIAPADYANPAIALDSNQRILITTADFALLRYLPNGTLDSSFGVNGKLSADFQSYSSRSEGVVIQTNTKIVAAGYVDYGDGLQEFALARFNNSVGLKPKAVNVFAKNNTITLFPNPVNNVLIVKGLNASTKYHFTIADTRGNVKAMEEINNTSMYNWNVQNLKSGLYYLNVVSGTYKTTLPFIKQ